MRALYTEIIQQRQNILYPQRDYIKSFSVHPKFFKTRHTYKRVNGQEVQPNTTGLLSFLTAGHLHGLSHFPSHWESSGNPRLKGSVSGHPVIHSQHAVQISHDTQGTARCRMPNTSLCRTHRPETVQKCRKCTAAYSQHVPWVVGAVLRVNVELFTLQGNKTEFQAKKKKSTGITIHLKPIKRNIIHPCKSGSGITGTCLSPCGNHLCLFIYLVSHVESTWTHLRSRNTYWAPAVLGESGGKKEEEKMRFLPQALLVLQ